MKVAAPTKTFPVLAAVAIAVAASTVPGASACARESGGCAARSGWMPDVAQRRGELEARFERFSSDATRNDEARAGEQWWRGAAARPALSETR